HRQQGARASRRLLDEEQSRSRSAGRTPADGRARARLRSRARHDGHHEEVDAMTVIDWATAGAALAGQASSGDRAVIVPFPGGALVAVIDGLGHGKEACEAAAEAEQVLVAAPYEPVDSLMLRCHQA